MKRFVPFGRLSSFNSNTLQISEILHHTSSERERWSFRIFRTIKFQITDVNLKLPRAFDRSSNRAEKALDDVGVFKFSPSAMRLNDEMRRQLGIEICIPPRCEIFVEEGKKT